jgi:hypothetical protein
LNLQNDPNLANIEHIAQALGDLRNSVVLVGGAVVGILITDANRPAARPTLDVDLVTKVSDRAEYYQICEVLRKAGFKENNEVICRWTKDEVLVDLMPTEIPPSWGLAIAGTSLPYKPLFLWRFQVDCCCDTFQRHCLLQANLSHFMIAAG